MVRRPSTGLADGPVAPADAPAPDPAVKTNWREWLRNLGRRQRQLREFAGLSQEELARLAGVSQGAVSRLEIARGLATPLLIVLKINAALARELRRLGPTVLTPELRDAIEQQAMLVGTRGVLGAQEPPIAEERELEEIVRLYRAAPGSRRQGFLTVLRAMLDDV
jgi:transcriptional regulator with XRE-family HTH domain